LIQYILVVSRAEERRGESRKRGKGKKGKRGKETAD